MNRWSRRRALVNQVLICLTATNFNPDQQKHRIKQELPANNAMLENP